MGESSAKQQDEARARELLPLDDLLGIETVGAAKQVQRLVAAAFGEVRRGQWIPCGERMPDICIGGGGKSVEVLFVVQRNGPAPFTSMGVWQEKRERWLDVETDRDGDHVEWLPGEVTHWMPLPEPPDQPGAERTGGT